MDPALMDEMDFSFSCDKCSFSTKDMVKIKLHMYGHRKQDSSQMVAAVGSGDAQQKDAQKDSAISNQADHNASQDSGDKGQVLDKTTPSTKNTPTAADMPLGKGISNVDTALITDTQTSSPPSQQRDGNNVQTLQEKDDSTEKIDEEMDRNMGDAQTVGREATVIVARREQMHATEQQQTDCDTSKQVTDGPDSIADRIHSRRRPTAKKPQEEPEDDEDYIPYRPVKHGLSRGRRHTKRVKRRITQSAVTNMRAKAKLRPKIPLDRYKCQNCHFVCKFKQNLRAHVRGSHPDVYAEIIQNEKNEKGEMDDGGVEGRVLEESGGTVDEAQPQISSERYKCNLCKTFSCRFKKDLRDHKCRVHGIPAPIYKYQSRIPEDRYQCLECDYVCKFQRTLRLHCRSVHPKIIKSPEAMEKKEKKEKKVPENRYQCPECDFACKFKGQLKNHRSKEHKKERPPKMVREQQCEFCNKFIQGTTHHYRRHLKTHTGDKPFKCPICEAVFGDQSRLNAHAPIHQEERNYLCDQCGKSFKRAINLRMHRKVHLVVRPHGCELCSYRCKRHDTLNLHMKRKHLKIRRILCATCGKKFFSEKECQLHAARKHLPRPTPFQCTFCPQAFPFAYNLRAHMKKHPEHKPFRCEFCSFESRSKASLQDHEKMHTGEKQKKCEMCDYTTSTSSNLYKHRKRQHGIVNRNKSPRIRSPVQDRHPTMSQPVILQGSPHASIPTTPLSTTPLSTTSQPHPMLPTPENLHMHHMQIQSHLQGALSPMPNRIQGAPSPALTPTITQSVTVPTCSGHMDLRNVQAYEEIDFKDRRAIIYGREKSLIGSVITEALAEARNVVQSEIYNSSHMIPSTVAPPGLHHTALPVTTTMAPPHGGIVSAEAILHSTIPTSTGIPPSGPSGIFNNIMNIHY